MIENEISACLLGDAYVVISGQAKFGVVISVNLVRDRVVGECAVLDLLLYLTGLLEISSFNVLCKLLLSDLSLLV